MAVAEAKPDSSGGSEPSGSLSTALSHAVRLLETRPAMAESRSPSDEEPPASEDIEGSHALRHPQVGGHDSHRHEREGRRERDVPGRSLERVDGLADEGS